MISIRLQDTDCGLREDAERGFLEDFAAGESNGEMLDLLAFLTRVDMESMANCLELFRLRDRC
jgi:hypothetical protein